MSGLHAEATRSLTDVHAEIHSEHEALHALTVRIEAASERTALEVALDELHAMLKTHFAKEEHPGGLYDQMGATGGTHRAAVRRLVDEHFMLVGAVDGLKSRLAQGESNSFEEMASEARGIVWMLGAHENRENDLVQATLQA